jgi:peptide/nickel transport system permease protein
MLALIARRLLLSVPLIFVVTGLSFALESLVPGNAATGILGFGATPAAIAQLQQQLGLNHPWYVQYYHWLGQLAHGSLGNSLINGQSVSSALNTRLPITLSLLTVTMMFAIASGVGLGTLTAIRRGAFSRAIDVGSVVGLAIPSFWLGLILISFFSVRLGWLPATGYVSFASSPADWLRSLTLPALALGLGQMTVLAKQTRDAMADTLTSPYVQSLRANGIRERSVIFRHAIRNAAIPVVTAAGLLFVGALSGAVVIEQLFVLPGLGSIAVQATSQHDIPMIQGVALYFTLIIVAVNLIVDLSYGWLNPRIRHR